MWLTKFFAVFVVLIGRICLSKIIIDTNDLDEFAELETAALRILENCYANKDKTIVVLGDFPGNFIKKLSAYQKLSIVSADGRRRAENNMNIYHWWQEKPQPIHKVHILVAIVPFIYRFSNLVQTYLDTQYYNARAYVLLLGWSPKRMDAVCDGSQDTFEMLYNIDLNNLQYANLICRHRTKKTMIYGFNGFTNYAPKPWRLFYSWRRNEREVFWSFEQEYRDDDGMCTNIFFDKTHDFHGRRFQVSMECPERPCLDTLLKHSEKDRRMHIEQEKNTSYIRNFITYINGTRVVVWTSVIVGKKTLSNFNSITVRPTHMRGIKWNSSFTYPHTTDCKYLITQFRGNKSQLKKIFDIIDSYSWVGVWIVYFITLIFFKYFLHQTLIEGLLNICRLSCNLGLTISPRNLASQIYFCCLLFYVVTMLGILTGNLAALLTHDTPVRQVNSIRDLIDLNYTVYARAADVLEIENAGFNNRIIEYLPYENCVQYVKRDPLVACLTWGLPDKEAAEDLKFHVGSDCITREYLSNIIPSKWYLEEQINKFLLIKIGGVFMTDLDVMVDEIRLLEADSEEVVLDPEIMTLADLGFAFAIFGFGLGCSLISFIVEIMIYRFQRRVTTTRVIVLN